MTPSTPNPELEKVKDLQMAFKSPVIVAYACKVVAVAVGHNEVWPDDIPITDIERQHKNVVGGAYRWLKNIGIIEHTKDFRCSTALASKGRTIFKWRLINESLAYPFLRRNGAVTQQKQTEFAI